MKDKNLGLSLLSMTRDLKVGTSYIRYNDISISDIEKRAKMSKVEKPKPLLKPKNWGETPNVRDIISALSGKGTVS